MTGRSFHRCKSPLTRALLAALLLGLELATLSPPAKARDAQDSWGLCADQAAHAEALLEIPAHLLKAIGRVESGRWRQAEAANFAWPWTVMAEGRGRYLPSKEAAIAEVKALRARGVKNIDVGCMQINLLYHSDAFDDLEQAFDPAFNTAYAAVFLVKLRAESRSWTRAIGLYHSRTPILSNKYRRKVLKAWREERHKASKAAQQVRLISGQP